MVPAASPEGFVWYGPWDRGQGVRNERRRLGPCHRSPPTEDRGPAGAADRGLTIKRRAAANSASTADMIWSLPPSWCTAFSVSLTLRPGMCGIPHLATPAGTAWSTDRRRSAAAATRQPGLPCRPRGLWRRRAIFRGSPARSAVIGVLRNRVVAADCSSSTTAAARCTRIDGRDGAPPAIGPGAPWLDSQPACGA